MNKTAFLFPGQGSQTIGMCKDIYNKYEVAKKMYDTASNILNIDVSNLCFNLTEEELNRTDNAQIAILVTSLAVLEVLKDNGIRADIVAGLSLGEYTACIYSGIISLEEGLRLVQKRGKYMQELKPVGNWKMAAVLDLDNSIIEKTCSTVSEEIGFVVPANYNYNRANSNIWGRKGSTSG